MAATHTHTRTPPPHTHTCTVPCGTPLARAAHLPRRVHGHPVFAVGVLHQRRHLGLLWAARAHHLGRPARVRACVRAWLRGCVVSWLRGCVVAWLRACVRCVRCGQTYANVTVVLMRWLKVQAAIVMHAHAYAWGQHARTRTPVCCWQAECEAGVLVGGQRRRGLGHALHTRCQRDGVHGPACARRQRAAPHARARQHRRTVHGSCEPRHTTGSTHT
jgi:hypothetical protein